MDEHSQLINLACPYFILQLVEEKETSERDKWEILKKAQAAAERCVELKTECDVKDHRIADLEQRLGEVRNTRENTQRRSG